MNMQLVTQALNSKVVLFISGSKISPWLLYVCYGLLPLNAAELQAVQL